MEVIISKRQRSPSFPYLTLTDSVEMAAKLYTAANAGFARIADIAEHWSVTAFSGSHLRYVSAMSEYGLIETKGSGKDRQIKLTDEAIRILEDEREGVKESLLAATALKPKMIRIIFNGSEKKDFSGWGFLRPSDSIAISTLKFDFKFTSDGAKKFLSIYDNCIEYLNPEDDPDIDSDKIVQTESSEETLQSLSKALFPSPVKQKTPVLIETAQRPAVPRVSTQEALIAFDMKTVSISGVLTSADELNSLIEDLKKLVPLMPK